MEVCRFRFLFAANKPKLLFFLDPFSVYAYIYIYIYIYAVGSKGKQEMEAQTIFLKISLPFAYRANGSLSFVHLLTTKLTEVICFPKRTKWTCPCMVSGEVP
jgi:hypothetical protein